jgi:hypothetical protein
MPEARLEIGARRGIERLPRRTEYVVHDGRHLRLTDVAGCDALRLQARMFLARLLRLAFGATSTAAANALELWLRHAHYLVGDAVRFVLERVIDGADLELRLKGTGKGRSRRRRSHGSPLRAVAGKY